MASKRFTQAAALVDRKASYAFEDAVNVLKGFPATKFNETVALSISLTIDPKKTDQVVRGTVTLPHGTGKARRVAVFCKGEDEILAKEAGAEAVGAAELIEKVQGGWLEFDVAVATPDLMRDVSRLGKILGPRGLMPNPKAGTVTDDVAKAIKEVKQGKVEFKLDKQADIHLGIGKRSFPEEALEANGRTLLEAIWKARPASAKGRFIRNISISTTMGPGVTLDPSEGKPAAA